MGIEPYLITATLNRVMAQRLARRICEECSEPWNPPDELLRRLARLRQGYVPTSSAELAVAGMPWNFRKGRGCARCGSSGYYGRIAIYEQFILTERIKQLIAEGARMHQVAQAAHEEGLQSLLESALHKVRDGVTTLDEAFSVCATQSELLG
jgi:type II secretory ATPase GspE/PulE/Tfp pilus assembly ATPase PilB-like protein